MDVEHVFLNQIYDWGYTHEFKIIRDYSFLLGCYFYNNITNDSIFIEEVEYSPDSIYIRNDGYSGTCWVVKVVEQRTKEKRFYHFRNFCDMEIVYQRAGYAFIHM